MAKKNERMEICDIPRGVDFTFPGVDSSKVIQGYPELRTIGLDFSFLWDNPIVDFIKDRSMKLFRRR